ncbi:MAG: isopenicillin N synthase family oxygenase [Gammaproteobacteria bacterium]|nr:isopenicillin N synthase family oxygenase [Gammaproteobacteria bacterium]
MNVQTIDFRAPAAGADLVQSLKDTGFAIIRGHPLSADLLGRLYRQWAEFFSSEEKHRYLMRPTKHGDNTVGYVPPDVSETAVGHPSRDIKEFYHVFPDELLPPHLADDTLAYLNDVFRVGVRLLDWLQDNMPDQIVARLPGRLSEILSREVSLLRVLHYPPLQGVEPELAIRAAPHEDINLITLLPVAEQPGLQVMDSQGRWLDLAGHRGDLIINAGDMLSEATGGHFPSTTHRVVNPDDDGSNVSRYSIPYFMAPRLDTVLSDRYTAGSYLAERIAELNRQ